VSPADDTKPELTVDEKRTRVNAARAKRELAEEDRKLDAEFARLELVERFERELGGREGQQFAIHDATDVGEGLFVVKLAPAIVWKTYWDSKMTDVDRCDLITPCIVHPDKETYLAARGRRQGIDAELTNLLAKLNGLKAKGLEGK
jgi:hypothetical protein